VYRQDAFLTHCCRLTQQEVGLKAIAALDKSLDEFTALLDAKDKQEIPLKQQEALGFVGQIEEAMVKGFPYEVPSQYANLPQLKVPLSYPLLPFACHGSPSTRSAGWQCCSDCCLVEALVSVRLFSSVACKGL
jgi:hypothetical protein